jgi:hypothetical protein
MAAVAQLFSTPSFIEEIDYTVEKEEERFCFNVWIWTDAPNKIALQGTLQIQEPLVNSDDYCYQLGDMDAPFFRDGPAETFDYNVLIHLDRVLDYTPLSDSSGEQGYESDTSGLPSDDSPAQEYPAKFSFTWHLGLQDGVPPRRASVHERLGGRGDREDRPPPPPPRGGHGGAGRMQQPPGSWHDLARMQHPGGGGVRGGGAGGFSGGRRQATSVEGVAAAEVGRPRKSTQFGKVSNVLSSGADDSFLLGERHVTELRLRDPMVDEAMGVLRPTASQPARPLRSVEPTMANAGSVVSVPDAGAQKSLSSEVVCLQVE